MTVFKYSELHTITKFNPGISTENLGDFIIEDYCNGILEELFGEYLGIEVPTRDRLSKYSRRKVASADYSFVLGTNLLSSHMNKWKQWNITLSDAFLIRFGSIKKRDLLSPQLILDKAKQTHVVLLGAGWLTYQNAPNYYTRCLLKTLLDDHLIHSVRDGYTERMMRQMGFENVINTSCPTMWRLTEEFCKHIPRGKAPEVITTFTDYRKAPEQDLELYRILRKKYKHIYCWLQSIADYDYLKQLELLDKVEVISPSLAAFDKILDMRNVDYIGTRLHGGIRALNYKRRSCIIAIDNRAKEIAKDTNLPIVDRNCINRDLELWIDDEAETAIHLPQENIEIWKKQFQKKSND